MPPDSQGAERLPPYNREAERGVLGSMLRDNTVIPEVLQILRPEYFYTDAHQKIYDAIIGLHDRGHPVDLVMLADQLKERQHLEDVGGYGYVGELWDAAPTAANARYYAEIVRDKGIVRNLIHASTEILRDAYDQAQSANDLLESAERKILDIAQLGVTGQTFTLEEAIHEAYTRIDKRHQPDAVAFSGLPTGFLDLDEKTAGLQESELIIIAARPSVGKTAFALNLARHIIVEENAPVFFVSLEQTRIELAERLLCSHARVDSHKLRKGHLSADDMEKLMAAGSVLSSAKLFIDDTAGQSMLRIAANARRLKLRHGIKLVMVDYLQLIDPDNRRDSRQEQVANISRRLKFLAKELVIPVVALAQVNRSSEDRQDHRPRLADLRESGCLAGATLIPLADAGACVPMRSLVGCEDVRVWALDEATLELKPAAVSAAFCTGRKPVYRLRTSLGREVRATGNHKFRTLTDWRRLDVLQVGDRIAVAPSPQLNHGDTETRRGEGGEARANRARSPEHRRKGLAEQTLSDVAWDRIIRIEAAGEEEVYDLTVPGPANFVAGDMIVHNSIEQDADTVMMLHRPELYEPGQHEGTVEVIIAKQRNGPTGEVTLTYLKQFMRFENFAVGTPFGD